MSCSDWRWISVLGYYYALQVPFEMSKSKSQLSVHGCKEQIVAVFYVPFSARDLDQSKYGSGSMRG